MATKAGTTLQLEAYRRSARERARLESLLRLVGRGGSALDVGSRDGFHAVALANKFNKVVALDLVKPDIKHERVTAQQGDATELRFDSNSFDVVLCAEVLEHIPSEKLQKVCGELLRVARAAVVIGVPFEQDLRCGQTTCENCGQINPPWGHVNSFSRERLLAMFPGCRCVETDYVGEIVEATNRISVALLNFAGNPYGTYAQDENCVHCGRHVGLPRPRTLAGRFATRIAVVLNRRQARGSRAKPRWIHLRLEKQ